MIHRIKVLYVEADRDWQEIMREIVATLGYHIDFAFTSKDALHKLKCSTYHIAVLDKRLDEYDPENDAGLRIATTVANSNEGTRIIIYTAYGTIEDAREAFREIKVRDFIPKIVPISEIRRALKDAAEEAILEFKRPSRYSEDVLIAKDNVIEEFLSKLDLRIGPRLSVQSIQLLAKRLLGEFQPLLPAHEGAQIVKTEQFSILQIRFWSKMLGIPIVTWFGKFDELHDLLQSLDSDIALRSSLYISNKIDELFDSSVFPDLGGAVFEAINADFEQFEDHWPGH